MRQPPTLRRFMRNFRWEAITLEPYKLATHEGGEFCGASRQVLIGHGNEPVKFHLRYFELAPGGFTSLERHRHCHVVIGVRGRGRVSVARTEYRIKPFDLVYIGPHQPHQLAALGRGRFGFFCIVDAIRDKPRAV
ncbi:MAG: cupin domain-containing protein [Candidatus Binataceae bacterium]